jgi:hypothetical protein
MSINDAKMSCFVPAQAGHVQAVHAHAGKLKLFMSVLHMPFIHVHIMHAHPIMPVLCTVVFYLRVKSEMQTAAIIAKLVLCEVAATC